MNLLVEVEQRFKRRLPLSILLEAPTLKQFAAFIQENEQRPANWSSLVPIREGGSLYPLFLVDGAEGNVLLYRELSNYLRKDPPVYGLQSLGLDGSGRLLNTIEEMASYYIREKKCVQSKGLYFLGGYCLGGIIALEMAQQLSAKGEKIALVGMIESYNLQVNRFHSSRLLSLVHLLQNVAYHLGNLLSIRCRIAYSFCGKRSLLRGVE